MNPQILDAPFDDEFNFLEEGETILWQARKNEIKPLEIKLFLTGSIFEHFFNLHIAIQITISSILISLLIFLFAENLEILSYLSSIALILFLLILYIIVDRIYFYNKKKRNYYITQQRLIFQTNKSQFHFIDLKDIESLFLKNSKNPKAILLEVKNHPTSEILTKQFIKGKSRIVGKIENIENVEEAIQLLKLPNYYI